MKKAHRRSRSYGFRVKCETHPRLEIIPKSIALFLGTAFISLALLAGYGFSQALFYQGKTVTLIVSTAPGGTGDLRVKALVPFLRKHIPGNPTIVTEYMDGGGGRKAANYLFRNARSDGLTVGAMGSGVVALHIMRESGVLYDIDKFIYLGAPETVGHQTIYARKELGLNNLEKKFFRKRCARL
jgi:tripartite-type tricarboxylate transporter receptor subunit TctC